MTTESDRSSLRGLRVLVTGGASGIGAATVEHLVSQGARVASLDLQHGSGPAEIHVSADLTSGVQVDEGVCEAAAALGGLDALVSNAGIGAVGTVLDNHDDEWRSVLDVNVLGLVRLVRAALPELRRSAVPSIVVTGSVVAGRGFPNRALYSASKGAVQALALAMAADLLGEGIRVNVVSPGTTDTPWVRRLLDASTDPEAQRGALIARQPLGRLVRAEEVAHAIAYLLHPRSASTTGGILNVDGGLMGLHGSASSSTHQDSPQVDS